MAIVKRTLSWLGWIVAAIFFGLSLQRLLRDNDLQTIAGAIHYGYLALATLSLFIGLFFRGMSGYFSLGAVQHPISMAQSYHYWFLSQLSKYIPGGIWQFATRSVMYNRSGASLALSSVLSVWEIVAVLFSGGIIVAVAGLALEPAYVLLWLFAIIGLCVLLALILQPSFWRKFHRLKIGLVEKVIDSLDSRGQQYRTMTINLNVLAFVGWLFICLSFHFVVQAFAPDASVNWLYSTFTYTLAWIIGFLVIIAPGGMGPRETVIVLLLASVVGDDLALSMALFSRLIWVVAEGMHIIMAALLGAVLKVK